MQLIDGAKGAFTVIADGTEVWNKHAAGGFPDEADLVRRIVAL